MERGLIWLPLLALFIGLAWAGWNEYQKVEAYRAWSKSFQDAKYDLYAMVGQRDRQITWGKPTRNGPIDLQTFSLNEVNAIRLKVDDRDIDLNDPPETGRSIFLEFEFEGDKPPTQIPFTEVPLAVQWGQRLQQELSDEVQS